MNRIATAFVLLAAFGAAAPELSARPEYLAKFQADPYRKADVDGCVTCHINPRGGGARNDFGLAFADAGHLITPLMRANFIDRFKVETYKLPNGSVFYFSDPESKVVVFERAGETQKQVIDLVTLAGTSAKKEDKLPPPANRMTFFVTSKGVGNGGHLGGLAGADAHCQDLAQAAGAGDLTWHAYLSTSFQDKPAINAGDRIGSGPWYNAKGVLIARGVSDLHKEARLSKDTVLTEKGEPLPASNDTPGKHDILTGTLPDGTAAVGMNCSNWTSNADGKVIVGNADAGGNAGPSSWNSAHPVNSCTQQTFQTNSGNGLFYCFALK